MEQAQSAAEASDGKPRFIVWYVYVLRSERDNKLYVGSTNDLKHRLWEHKCGKVDSTKCRVPVQLEAYIAVKSKSKAIALEAYLKTGSGKAVLNKRIL